MKRHRFLLLDDQGPGAAKQGWPRTASVLQQYGFLRHVPEKAEAGWLQDDILVRVLSADWDGSGAGDRFDTAVQLFEKESGAGERGEFDAFFCDINLSTNDSPEETNMMDPARQVAREEGTFEYLNTSEMARLYQTNLATLDPTSTTSSRFAAGLDLLEMLPNDDPRPKIVYSASDATKSLRNVIKKHGRKDIHLVDIVNGEFVMGSAVDDLNNYLKLRQLRVLRGLEIETIRMLLQHANRTSDGWDLADIPDCDDRRQMWSLRTLFPREVNSIAAAASYERAAEGVRALHEVIALDFRWVFQFFAGHPQGLQYSDADRQQELERLRELEFSLSDKAKGYEPSSALEPGQLQAGALRHLLKLADGNHARELEWRACARSYGLYPGDVWYLTSILDLNRKHGGAMTPPRPPAVEVSETRDPLELCWRFETAADERRIAAMVKKFKAAERRIREQALSDQGMTDLAVIACGRYKGVLRYEGEHFTVTVQLRNGALEIEQSRHEKELPPRICVTIDAPDERP